MAPLSLSNEMTERLRRAAARRNTNVEALLERAVDAYLDDEHNELLDEPQSPSDQNWWQQQHHIIEREHEAYVRQHAQLYARYANEYIVMHDGAIVDHDLDRRQLSRRVRTRFGRQPVLITQVLPTPERTIIVRTPRLQGHTE
jgi:hypothetical protein